MNTPRLSINARLLNSVRLLSGKKTFRGAVKAALREYVARRAQLGMLDLLGSVEFREGFDSENGRPKR